MCFSRSSIFCFHQAFRNLLCLLNLLYLFLFLQVFPLLKFPLIMVSLGLLFCLYFLVNPKLDLLLLLLLQLKPSSFLFSVLFLNLFQSLELHGNQRRLGFILWSLAGWWIVLCDGGRRELRCLDAWYGSLRSELVLAVSCPHDSADIIATQGTLAVIATYLSVPIAWFWRRGSCHVLREILAFPLILDKHVTLLSNERRVGPEGALQFRKDQLY